MKPQTLSADTQKISDLVARDYHLGLLAQVTEYAHRASAAQEQLELETKKLEKEMTRAYQAESALLDAQKQLHVINSLRDQLAAIQQSKTWKIGRLVTFPIRLLRRILSFG